MNAKRTCQVCNKEKSINSFRSNNKTTCKECITARTRLWRENANGPAKIDGHTVFRSLGKLMDYVRGESKPAFAYWKCPTCGHIRKLKRVSVLHANFFNGSYRHCIKCARIYRRDLLPEIVDIQCPRCKKVRHIQREIYLARTYDSYCPTCLDVINRNKQCNEEWNQDAIKRLPKTCTPARDPKHPSGNRQYFCRHYDRCLDVCVAKAWPGFVCSQCSGGELEPLEQRMLPWSTIMEIMPDISFG